jgi:hypothetical protein
VPRDIDPAVQQARRPALLALLIERQAAEDAARVIRAAKDKALDDHDVVMARQRRVRRTLASRP